MGADMFIKSIFDRRYNDMNPLWEAAIEKRNNLPPGPAHDAAHAELESISDIIWGEGYYRDSYNSSNLLWILGLDYWKYVGALLDNTGYMSVGNMVTFYRAVHEREVPYPLPNDVVSPEETHDEAYQYFVDKRQQLLAFLTVAINKIEPIYCSI